MKFSRCFSFWRSGSTRNDWSIPSPLRSSASSRKCLGFLRYSSDSRSISTGMVAEKSDMVLSSGVRSSMNWMSSMNPMSNMVSASSSTTCRTSFSSTDPRLRWSMSLPGVATSISTPLFKASICTLIAWPPYIVATRMSVYLPNLRSSSVICMASSLVGATTNP